ncbi:MAG: response regulator [Acidimicrobiia bacterium]|nr:response regulator [Acidimicrobiia bacterium]
MRILFVDDEQLVLAGLRRMLRPLHKEWDMEFVTSGNDALVALQQDEYDLVVSDVRMPGMDGIELLDRIRETHPDLIRVILSGHSDQVDTLRSTAVAHQYLAKPCEADVIRSTVARSTALRHDLSDPELLAAIAATKSLPSVPALYQQLTEELTSGSASLAGIASIVAQDPALTAKILQIVNSAFFALRREVADIEQAVTMLGTDTIMALALTMHLFSQGEMNAQQKLVVEKVWTRALAVATLAKAICTADGNNHAVAQEAFLAGMLHDAGKVVLTMNWPDRISELADADVESEREAFGSDHALVGAYLLAMWGLPDVIVEAVAYHHEPSLVATVDSPVLTAVHVAHALETRQNGEPPAFDQAYLEPAGLADRVEAWLQVAEDVAYERENA